MSDRLETELAFFTDLRAHLAPTLDDAGREALDAYARAHFDTVTILEAAAADEAAPATSAEHLEHGIFQLVVALVVHYRSVTSSRAARARVAEYLQRLLVGLADEDPTPERTEPHGR